MPGTRTQGLTLTGAGLGWSFQRLASGFSGAVLTLANDGILSECDISLDQ